MRNIDKYLKLVVWAQKRYTIDHTLIVSVGVKPSIYSRIEQLAFRKYFH